MTGITSNKPLKDLVSEAKAEVIEELEDLAPDQVPVSTGHHISGHCMKSDVLVF